MAEVMSLVPADHPLMKAWEGYRATNEYQNSKRWALRIAPMVSPDDPDAERKRLSLMPIDQREQHVEGSLWAAFSAGFTAAGAGNG